MPANASLIATLIIDRPLCAPCISQKSGLSVDEIKSYLTRIADSVVVTRSTDACRACGNVTEVFSMSRTE